MYLFVDNAVTIMHFQYYYYYYCHIVIIVIVNIINIAFIFDVMQQKVICP